MKSFFKLSTCALAISFCFCAGQQVQASDNEVVNELLSKMTLEEKIGQMLQPDTRSISPNEVAENYIGSILSGGGAAPITGNTGQEWANRFDEYQQAAVNSFGIPLLYGVDAVHGHNNVSDATIFPHNINLGQTKDKNLVREIGVATAKEMRATGANWSFTPTLGMPKNERWGRTYECFGENVELVSTLGKAYIEGIQGEFTNKNALSTAKHFVGEGLTKGGVNQGDVELAYNSVEFQELLTNELLPPYQAAIDAGVKSIMVSYNSINGQKCHGNKELITDLLKEEMKFEGIVISDYNGVDQIEGNGSYADKVVQGINAGIDILMVDDYENDIPKWKLAKEAVKNGVETQKISEDRINDAVQRILKVKDELNLLDKNDQKNLFSNTELLNSIGSEEHRQLARKAVQKSLTLLKNTQTATGNTLNDLQNSKNIIVSGSSSNDIGMQCGGWTISWQGAKGDITKGTTIYDGLKEVAGKDKTIDYSEDGHFEDGKYDVALLVMGEEPYAEYAGDRTSSELQLSLNDQNLIKKIKKEHPELPIVAVLTTGRPINIANFVDDFDGIIMAGFPGSEGAGVADILLTDQDFSGKLSISWPWYPQDIEKKLTDKSKVLFEIDRGLSKKETTPIVTEKPQDPTIIDLKTTDGVIRAIDYALKSEGINLENNNSTIGHFWEECFLIYNVKIPQKARYTLVMNTATGSSVTDVAFDVYVDGELYYQVDQELENTGGWNVFEELEFDKKISLPEGIHEIKIVSRGRDFNIDYFKFEKFDDNYTDPQDPNTETENQGEGALIKEEAVSVSLSSSENSQSMSWYTNPQEIKNKNAEQEPLDIRNQDGSSLTSIVVDDSKEYQSILGLGISIEESTVNNMLKMSVEKRREFIRKIIDKEDGMGNTLFRITIGTSDFTGQEFYTYYDGSGKELDGNPDWNNKSGQGFSIQKDKDYGIISVVKEIQQIAEELGLSKEIKFFASSWTPPGWMKKATSSSESYENNELLLKGGKLNDLHINDLAKYYVRFIEEYAKEGIPIYAITLQNEPLLEISYPSCYITGEQEAKIAKKIKEEIQKSTILSKADKEVKLWAFDHNFDGAESYMEELFNVSGGVESIDGIAFHPYGGVPSTMGKFYNQYKDTLSMNLTERAVWGTSGANDIIDWFRNGAESYNGWVTMLDSEIAPHQWVGTPDPSLFVQDAQDRDHYWETPEVYIVGQFTKYIRPGYVRIDTNNGSKSTVTNVAFKNPDTGEIILVVTNRSGKDQEFKVVLNKTQFNALLPAGNTATYRWNPIDTSKIKEITDDLRLTDATINGSGDFNNGVMENIDTTTELEYLVNVVQTGTYKVEIETTAENEADSDFPVQIIQDDSVIGNFSTSYIGNNFEKIQTYITFKDAGFQKFKIIFPNGGIKLKNLKFKKDEAIQFIPGILTTDNYFYKYRTSLTVGEKDYFGHMGVNSFVDYKVEVLSGQEYPMVIQTDRLTGDVGVEVSLVDEDGVENKLEEFKLKKNENTHKLVIKLQQGEKKLRFKIIDGSMNVSSILIGNGIQVEQPDLFEGTLNNQIIKIRLLSGQFASKLEKEKWKLNLPEGLDFSLKRLSNSEVELKLLGEIEEALPYDKQLKLSIDSSQYGESSMPALQGWVRISSIEHDEKLIAPKEVEFGQTSFDIVVEDGTFSKQISEEISLSDNIQKYVKIKEINRVSPTKVTLDVEWIDMYDDINGTIQVSEKGLSTENKLMTADILFKKTSDLPKSIDISKKQTELKEEMSYRSEGSLNNKTKAGNYLDFYLNIVEEDDYVITYQVKTAQNSSNALKLSGGFGLATDNLSSISFPNYWGNFQEYRNSLHMKKGEQTIRFELNADGVEIGKIMIRQKNDPILVNSNTTIGTDYIVDGSKDKCWAIETKENGKIIGFTESGTYIDYWVDVDKAGVYQFSMLAGGESASAFGVLQHVTKEEVKDLGKVKINKTKDWGTLTESESSEISLDKGKQTLRIYVENESFNYQNFMLNYLKELTDTSKLEQLVSEIEKLNKTDFTAESWNTLEIVWNQAKELLINQTVTQAEVDKMYHELLETKEKLILNEEINSIKLSVNSLEILKKGKTLKIEVETNPVLSHVPKLTWNVQNEKIASVDENGVVTAKANGTTKITATTENGKSASFTLRVSN